MIPLFFIGGYILMGVLTYFIMGLFNNDFRKEDEALASIYWPMVIIAVIGYFIVRPIDYAREWFIDYLADRRRDKQQKKRVAKEPAPFEDFLKMTPNQYKRISDEKDIQREAEQEVEQILKEGRL